MHKFIKVIKGKESHVILSANRRFYESQGWKVEDATYEEAIKAFPDYAEVIAQEYGVDADADEAPVEKPKRGRKSNN